MKLKKISTNQKKTNLRIIRKTNLIIDYEKLLKKL